ncbi:MAG: Trp repressor protein [Microgenomates bacterium OLB23]|nr:MAG: Trp repressor protein [Microgenomates bacterium OLB23]
MNAGIITTSHLLDSDYFDVLVVHIKNISTEKTAREFILSVLTPLEAYRIGQRITIVSLLECGYDYADIIKLLKVSSTTVARASRQLQDGMFGYYTNNSL